jgi:riboflavin synthase
MFTGLIEELGTLVDREDTGSSLRLLIKAGKVLSDLKIDDSIAVNGCCQTVVGVASPTFEVIAVRETLQKTTLGSLKIGEALNLERAVTLGTRLGGHLVQGHIDSTSELLEVRDLGGSWEFWFELPAAYRQYVIPVGSIAVNGVSLTVADVREDRFKVAIIPHTFEVTTFHDLEPGQRANIEYDAMAKMVERMLLPYRDALTAAR